MREQPPDLLAEILDAERSALAPDDALARVWSKTARTIGVPVGPSGPAVPKAPAGSAASKASSGWAGFGGAVGSHGALVVAATVAIGGAGVGLHVWARAASAPRPVPAMASPIPQSNEARRPAEAKAIEPARTAPPMAEPMATEATARLANDAPLPRPAPPLHTAAATLSPPSSLSAERDMLDRARAALGRNDGADALRWIDEHVQRFPKPRLGEEREALAVQALVLGHRYDEARERGASFETTWKNSLFLPAVVESLASIP
jgi:hypothetical protein